MGDKIDDDDDAVARAIEMSLQQSPTEFPVDQIPQSQREAIAVEEHMKQEEMFVPYVDRCPQEPYAKKRWISQHYYLALSSFVKS